MLKARGAMFSFGSPGGGGAVTLGGDVTGPSGANLIAKLAGVALAGSIAAPVRGASIVFDGTNYKTSGSILDGSKFALATLTTALAVGGTFNFGGLGNLTLLDNTLTHVDFLLIGRGATSGNVYYREASTRWLKKAGVVSEVTPNTSGNPAHQAENDDTSKTLKTGAVAWVSDYGDDGTGKVKVFVTPTGSAENINWACCLLTPVEFALP